MVLSELWVRVEKSRYESSCFFFTFLLLRNEGASAYASAISEILPDCVQVADRFHSLIMGKDETKLDLLKETTTNSKSQNVLYMVEVD